MKTKIAAAAAALWIVSSPAVAVGQTGKPPKSAESIARRQAIATPSIREVLPLSLVEIRKLDRIFDGLKDLYVAHVERRRELKAALVEAGASTVPDADRLTAVYRQSADLDRQMRSAWVDARVAASRALTQSHRARVLDLIRNPVMLRQDRYRELLVGDEILDIDLRALGQLIELANAAGYAPGQFFSSSEALTADQGGQAYVGWSYQPKSRPGQNDRSANAGGIGAGSTPLGEAVSKRQLQRDRGR